MGGGEGGGHEDMGEDLAPSLVENLDLAKLCIILYIMIAQHVVIVAEAVHHYAIEPQDRQDGVL